MTEREFHAHRGEPAERSNGRYCIPDDDTAPHISQYDDEAVGSLSADCAAAWTLDVTHDKHARMLGRLGAVPLPCAHEAGQLFRLTAQQLIEFIAADAGLNVEFRKRKKRTLTDEQRAELAERMKRINAERNGVVI